MFKKPIIIGVVLAVTITVALILNNFPSQQSQEDFKAPGRGWQSPKKVEDYFVSNLRMTPEDLERNKDRTAVDFRPSKTSTLEGIVGNLAYYGFIRDERAFRYALEHTEDKTPSREPMVKTGKSGTIDLESSYRISEDMTAWELADTLLNKPTHFSGDTYPGYLFMP